MSENGFDATILNPMPASETPYWHTHGKPLLKKAVLTFIDRYGAPDLTSEQLEALKRYYAILINTFQGRNYTAAVGRALLTELHDCSASDLWRFTGKLSSFGVDPL